MLQTHKQYPGPSEDTRIEDLDPEGGYAKTLAFVGRGKRVLEFGCATGFMSRLLRVADNRVTAIEIDPEAAACARRYCESVLVADLDVQPLAAIVGGETFDVALFGDVLEHLRDPWRVLDETRALLEPDGYAVMSIPNVAHGSVRLALLRGEFDYQKIGLLDDTHLRFFTARSIRSLCLRSGYAIEAMDRTVVSLFEDSPVTPQIDRASYPAWLLDEIESDPHHDTLQFLVKARRLDDGAKAAALIEGFANAEAALERAEESIRRIDAESERRRCVIGEYEERIGTLSADRDALERRADLLANELALANDGVTRERSAATAKTLHLEAEQIRLLRALDAKNDDLHEVERRYATSTNDRDRLEADVALRDAEIEAVRAALAAESAAHGEALAAAAAAHGEALAAALREAEAATDELRAASADAVRAATERAQVAVNDVRAERDAFDERTYDAVRRLALIIKDLATALYGVDDPRTVAFEAGEATSSQALIALVHERLEAIRPATFALATRFHDTSAELAARTVVEQALRDDVADLTRSLEAVRHDRNARFLAERGERERRERTEAALASWKGAYVSLHTYVTHAAENEIASLRRQQHVVDGLITRIYASKFWRLKNVAARVRSRLR